MLFQIGFKKNWGKWAGHLNYFLRPSGSSIIDFQLKTQTTQIRCKAVVVIENWIIIILAFTHKNISQIYFKNWKQTKAYKHI